MGNVGTYLAVYFPEAYYHGSFERITLLQREKLEKHLLSLYEPHWESMADHSIRFTFPH